MLIISLVQDNLGRKEVHVARRKSRRTRSRKGWRSVTCSPRGLRLIQSVWSRSWSRSRPVVGEEGKLAGKRAARRGEERRGEERIERGRGEEGPGSISEEVEEEESRRSGQAQAPVRSMPVSRSYKALVLGGRATVGVPHSEHAPRRESIVSRNKRFVAVSSLEDKRSACFETRPIRCTLTTFAAALPPPPPPPPHHPTTPPPPRVGSGARGGKEPASSVFL